MEEIIVTGATGFIGRRLIKELLKHYPAKKILCLIKDNIADNYEPELSGRKILKDLNIKTREIDLVSGKGLDNLPAYPKIIFHLGASTESGDKDHSCNDIGTKNLLKSFPGINSETKFIFTSSAAVYSGRNDTEKPIDHETIPFPSNEYGRSKLRAEEILKEAASKHGLKVTVLRLNTVWGESTRNNGLFDKMNKLMKDNSILSRLNWPGRTGLLNIYDAAQIIIFFSTGTSKNNFSVYNVAHESLTLSQISEILHEKSGRKYLPVKLPDIFWNVSKSFVRKSSYFENVMPAGIYNNFWRLNLIVNDSLCSKSDEILELVHDLKIDMKRFE